MTWVQLPKDKAHFFYRVPLELASEAENAFFGTRHHPRDTDGPWPLLAFVKNENPKGVWTFQIFTIESEALEAKGFSPLTETGGYLFLTRSELADLARLLLSYADKLPPEEREHRAVFRRIEPSKLKELRIHSPLTPNSRDYFYELSYPMSGSTGEKVATLAILSAATAEGRPSGLYFKIAQFPLPALREPSFNVLDDALAKIKLSRSGLEELAGILEMHGKELLEDR